MNVAFVYPPSWAPWAPSYAMALLKAVTLRAGHNFHGFDLNIDTHNAVAPSDQALWRDDGAPFWSRMAEVETFFRRHADFFDDYARRILATGAPLVAFSVTSASSNCAILMARLLKRLAPGITVVLGGPDCFRAERGLALLNEPAIDAICTGEGELVWPAFLDAFAAAGELDRTVPGFCYRDGKEIIDCGDPPIVTGLDDMPPADYAGIDFGRYTLDNRVCMMMSRGCILRCSYCSEGANFLRYRWRSADNLAAEVTAHVTLLRRHSGKRPHINFSDSLINGRPDILERFCQLVIDRGIDFTWGGMALLRKEMSADLLALMHRAGCVELMWGLESGSADTLQLMRKKLFDPVLAETIFRMAHEQNIAQYTNIIVGFPGETDEQFAETAAFLRRVAPYFTSVGLPLMELRRNSHVFDNPGQYGIAEPRLGTAWSTGDGTNTLAMRQERRAVLLDILKDKLFDQGRYGAANSDLQDLLAELAAAGSRETLPPDALEGWTERVVAGRAQGWAWSPRRPGLKLPVVAWVDGRKVAEAMANEHRDDLRDSGRGEGNYGFTLAVPDGAEVVVTVGETGVRL